jgi:hypothetical protein
MAIKTEWLSKEEIRNLQLAKKSDDELKAEFGLSDYSISQIRKSEKHIQEISLQRINGLRVPTHMAMYLMHAQACKSRDYHYLIDRETGQIIQRIYVSAGAWVDHRPENSYELSLGMSDIPERPTYRDLLESFVEQMGAQ